MSAITYITQLNINGSGAYQLFVSGTAAISSTLKIGTYTLPATDGSAGQVLCTNGSGTVSWGVGGGSGWCGTAGSNLNMTGYCIYGGTSVCMCCFVASRKMVLPVGTNCY